MIDMLGFGISDRPEDFDYTLEGHADAARRRVDPGGVSAAEVVAHSMGGAVAIALAARHPALVANLILVDAILDPVVSRPAPGSRGIATYTEEEFLAEGWDRTLEMAGPSWAATMRLAGREALYRSAVHLIRGTTPTMRELLLELPIPRTYLYPAANGGLTGATGLTDAGVRVVPIPDCGHNIMVDNVDGFARAVAARPPPASR